MTTTTKTRRQRKHPSGQTSVHESKRQKADQTRDTSTSPPNDSDQPSSGLAYKSQKLGDKITALQQLVSPYGKADTASVLEEVGVYIKFLHEQIRMLSSLYFGRESSSSIPGERGLCLVPISSAIENTDIQEEFDRWMLERMGWGDGIYHH